MQGYFDETIARITNAESVGELTTIHDEIYDAKEVLSHIIDTISPCNNFSEALFNELVRQADKLDELTKGCDNSIDALEEAEANAKKNGSYEAQVKSTYYGGQS